jgi:hypothetical protein
MSRLLGLTLVVGMAGFFGGCAMCCAPFDCDYPSVPGRWTRHNPASGRVGSAFDEAGGPADVVVATAAEEVPPAQSVTPMPPPGPMRSPSDLAPGTRSVVPRSVVPRTMGETYLPRGQ